MQKFSAKLQKLLPEPSLFVMPDLFLHLKKDDEMSVLADTIKKSYKHLYIRKLYVILQNSNSHYRNCDY